jgi:xylulokinase
VTARPAVVGIDVGTGSARALAIGDDGAVLARASGAYPGRDTWPRGRAELDGWRAGVAIALAALGIDEPVALGVGSQSPTTVPLDGPLAVTVRHPAGITGSPLDQHLAQREVLAAEMGADDPPVAQLWDWLLADLGAPLGQTRWPGDPDLPGYGPRRPTGSVAGEADGSWGVPAGTPLVGGAQDAYLAFWAGGTDVAGRAVDPGGRTGGLAVAVERGSVPEDPYALSAAAAGIYLVGGPFAAHGLMLDWLATITGRGPAELTEMAGSVPPGAGGLLALPYLEGERAPRWNRGLRAELVGLGSEHGPAHLARAVLEGTAYGLRHLVEDLGTRRLTVDRVVVGGSPARSRTWCQIKADVLEVPVERPDEPDLTAYGAALAAGAGVGWWPAPGDGGPGSWPRPAHAVLEPRPDPAYHRGYQRFLALGDAAVARLSKEQP